MKNTNVLPTALRFLTRLLKSLPTLEKECRKIDCWRPLGDKRQIAIYFVLSIMVMHLGAAPRFVDLTILQTTDIHSHIDLYGRHDSDGDWLRQATVIRQERSKAGGPEMCLLIDCGDTIQGTLIGAVTQGEISVKMLNALNYDGWILGNHELDFGLPRLRHLLNQCRVPVINGNFHLGTTPDLPRFKFYRKNTATIAVIGMNANRLKYWSWGESMTGFEVQDAATVIEEVLPLVMRKTPDMILLALHQGYMERDTRGVNEIKEIARRFPQIDLILGGHTHREFPGRKVGNAWYVQAGKHGEFVGKINARIDTKKHDVVDLQSHLLSIKNAVPDETCYNEVKPMIDRAAAFARQTVCAIDRNVTSTGLPGIDCHMSEIICRAMSTFCDVPVVFHGVLRTKKTWWGGRTLTEQNLFDTIPYENGIGVADLSIAEIAIIIQEQFGYRGKRSFNGLYGLYADMDINTNRPKQLYDRNGNPLNDDHRVLVAFNSYVIAGGGGRFPLLREILRRPSSRLTSVHDSTREVVRAYLKTHDGWKSPPSQWIRFDD